MISVLKQRAWPDMFRYESEMWRVEAYVNMELNVASWGLT